MSLIDELIERGRLKTTNIISAFRKVPRINFMAPEYKAMAEVDNAFPIGWGQTISQPTTVAFMLELLQPQEAEKILDIGFGSGWTTALLAEIVGRQGLIYAIEYIKEVYHFGKENVRKLGYTNVNFFCCDGSGGLPRYAPYDRILASASAPEVFEPFKQQLNVGGRLVIPVQDTVTMIERKSKKEFKKEIYPFFAFVPMRGKYGYDR